MKIRNILIAVVASVAASHATSVLAYDGWSVGTIKTIRYQSSRILLQMNYDTSNTSNVINPSLCGGKPSNVTDYIYLQQAEDVFSKNMHAALLAAYAANKTVLLAISGCMDGYPKVTEAWVQ